MTTVNRPVITETAATEATLVTTTTTTAHREIVHIIMEAATDIIITTTIGATTIVEIFRRVRAVLQMRVLKGMDDTIIRTTITNVGTTIIMIAAVTTMTIIFLSVPVKK